MNKQLSLYPEKVGTFVAYTRNTPSEASALRLAHAHTTFTCTLRTLKVCLASGSLDMVKDATKLHVRAALALRAADIVHRRNCRHGQGNRS